MTRLPFILALILIATTLFAGENGTPPDETRIKQALERGKSLREQTALIPQALFKVAIVMKVGGVRYGHAIVKLEDSKGLEGSVYKLSETMKTCSPEGVDQKIVEYTAELYLAADLSLLSGRQTTTQTMTFEKKKDKETVKVQEKEVVIADVAIKNNETLMWVRREKRADDPETISNSDPIKTHGVRPVPRNALLALAAIAAREPGFKAGISSPFIVPAIDTAGNIDEFLIQGAWLETDIAKDKNLPAAKLVLRERFIDGKVGEKGFSVEAPPEETWDDYLAWSFDEKFNVVGSPSVPDADAENEIVDIDKLDLNAPFEFDKIKTVLKAIDDKRHKEIERAAKFPLK